jgi:hypothetical protein
MAKFYVTPQNLVKPEVTGTPCPICCLPLYLPVAVRYLPNLSVQRRGEVAGEVCVVVHRRCERRLDATVAWADGVHLVPAAGTSNQEEVAS